MKRLRKCLLIFLVLLFAGCANKDEISVDYYTYINEDIIDGYVLEDDEYSMSTFDEIQEDVDDQIDLILDDVIKDNTNVNILYNQLMNMEERNKNGLSYLKKYIDLIDSSKNINEFINNSIIVEEELYVPIFSLMSVMSDFKDTSKNILYLSPVTFDFGASSDYYVDDDYLSQRAVIKQYGIKILKEYGYDKTKAREVSKKVTDYYTSIASVSKLSSDLIDVENMYNIITKDEYMNIYDKLPSHYFEFIDNDMKLSIVDKNNYQAINDSLTDENLDVLKESVKLKILQTYSPYLGENYAKIADQLDNEQLGIVMEFDPEYVAENTVLKLFQYDIDKLYSDKYLTNEAKEYIESMIDDILKYYEINISEIDWLESSTKEKAIDKLKNINVNIGLANNYPKYSLDYKFSSNKSLIENIISAYKIQSDYELLRLQSNNKVPLMNQITVNAYYNPQDNSINFPAASINFVDFDKTYYENLGSIGMVIAHEVTHAFDANGSKFDEHGNLVNWWSDEDRKEYKKLQEEVVEYYNKYEVISGNYIDGNLTLSENIADLGAVLCISNIAESKKASNDEIRSMYKNFAYLWVQKSRDEYTKMLLLVDTHSPNKYRVNATLASTDLFYEVYNISENNPMYVSKEDRVKIW